MSFYINFSSVNIPMLPNQGQSVGQYVYKKKRIKSLSSILSKLPLLRCESKMLKQQLSGVLTSIFLLQAQSISQHNIKAKIIRKYLKNVQDSQSYSKYLRDFPHLNILNLTPSFISKLEISPKILLLQSPSVSFMQNSDSPSFIFAMSKLYEEQVQQALCALGNSKNGGSIIIANRVLGSNLTKIQQGFKYSDYDSIARQLKQRFQSALKKIYNQTIVQKIIIQCLPIYRNVTDFFEDRHDQVVVKVQVVLHQLVQECQNRRMFFIWKKLGDKIPATFEFCKPTFVESHEGTFSIFQKVKESEIYNFMQKISKLSCPFISKNIFSIPDNIQIRQLNNQITEETKKKKIQTIVKNTYNFSNNSKQFFISLVKSLLNENIDEEIPQFKQHYKIQELQIETDSQDKLNQAIEKLENFFAEKKIQFGNIKEEGFKQNENKSARILYILPECQLSIINHNKKNSPSTPTFIYIYLIFEFENDEVIKNLKYIFQLEFRTCWRISEVAENIKIAGTMSQNEIDLLLEFLYQKFCIIPKIKKVEVPNLMTEEKMYKNIQFQFPKFDKGCIICTFFLMSASKKRPSSIFIQPKKL